MSFSTIVKEEVSRKEFNEIEKTFILISFVKINGILRIQKEGQSLQIQSSNAKIAKLIFLIFKELFEINPVFTTFKKTNLKKNQIYLINIKEKINQILKQLKLEKNKVDFKYLKDEILKNNFSKNGYLIGAFLASGSINSPFSKSYHLEISTTSKEHSQLICDIMKKKNLNAKTIQRRSTYVVYIKKSEQISDFLKLLKAQESVLLFEDQRISKDYWNVNNRLNVCDVYNEVKTLESAARQIKNIEFIKARNKLYLLNEKQKQLATLRLENTEASLSDLTDIYKEKSNKTISKSGVNHSFRKIKEVTECLKKEEQK